MASTQQTEDYSVVHFKRNRASFCEHLQITNLPQLPSGGWIWGLEDKPTNGCVMCVRSMYSYILPCKHEGTGVSAKVQEFPHRWCPCQISHEALVQVNYSFRLKWTYVKDWTQSSFRLLFPWGRSTTVIRKCGLIRQRCCDFPELLSREWVHVKSRMSEERSDTTGFTQLLN